MKKGIRDRTSGRSLSAQKFLEYPPPPGSQPPVALEYFKNDLKLDAMFSPAAFLSFAL